MNAASIGRFSPSTAKSDQKIFAENTVSAVKSAVRPIVLCGRMPKLDVALERLDERDTSA